MARLGSPIFLMVLTLAPTMAWARGGREEPAARNPPRPAFESTTHATDEGTVKPIDRASPTPIKIAVLGLENNPFWIPVKEGTLAAAAELKPLNCTVDWIDSGSQHTTDVFGAAIEAAMVQNYDAIATVAGDSGIVPYIDRAVDSNIPVATFDAETASPNKRLFFVGVDVYEQGQTAGMHMEDLLDGKGKVAVITGFFSVEAHELRRKGFEDYIAQHAPGIAIVGRVENHDQADIAYTEAQDFMNANPDLSAIYVTAGGPFGAAKAVEDANKAGKVKIICYDFVKETMDFVRSGVITATMGQDPFAQGHDPAIRLFNYLVGRVMPPAGRLLTRSDYVTKDNVDKFYQP